MSKILCSFPGKFGDVIWALPSLRALSRRIGAPVDLIVAAPFASICPLIRQQDYIGKCWADPAWQTQDTAPISPRVPSLSWDREAIPDHDPWAAAYDHILHLGYRGWPQRPLPYETLDCLNAQLPPGCGARIPDDGLIEEAWIAPAAHSDRGDSWGLVVGFTDEYVELKMGICFALGNAGIRINLLAGEDSRKQEWLGANACDYDITDYPGTWEEARWQLSNCHVFLGDCSALHVLAVAVGCPRILLMEPAEARWNPIFYPCGKTGRVQLIGGNDGKPTWDARHVRDVVHGVLHGAVQAGGRR